MQFLRMSYSKQTRVARSLGEENHDTGSHAWIRFTIKSEPKVFIDIGYWNWPHSFTFVSFELLCDCNPYTSLAKQFQACEHESYPLPLPWLCPSLSSLCRGVQLTNPFYSIWTTDVGTELAVSFLDGLRAWFLPLATLFLRSFVALLMLSRWTPPRLCLLPKSTAHMGQMKACLQAWVRAVMKKESHSLGKSELWISCSLWGY